MASKLFHKALGVPADEQAVLDHYYTSAAHLLPPRTDNALVERAYLDGILAARGEHVKLVGLDEPTASPASTA